MDIPPLNLLFGWARNEQVALVMVYYGYVMLLCKMFNCQISSSSNEIVYKILVNDSVENKIYIFQMALAYMYVKPVF